MAADIWLTRQQPQQQQSEGGGGRLGKTRNIKQVMVAGSTRARLKQSQYMVESLCMPFLPLSMLQYNSTSFCGFIVGSELSQLTTAVPFGSTIGVINNCTSSYRHSTSMCSRSRPQASQTVNPYCCTSVLIPSQDMDCVRRSVWQWACHLSPVSILIVLAQMSLYSWRTFIRYMYMHGLRNQASVCMSMTVI